MGEFTLLAVLTAAVASGQAPEFVRDIGGSQDETPASIVADGSGVYVSGLRVLWKFDFDGNELWLRRLAAAEAAGQVVVNSGAVYLAGSTVAPGAGRDVFVRKYDAKGNEVWTRQFHSPGEDFPAGIAQDGDGVYIAQNGPTAKLRKLDVTGSELWSRDLSAPAAGIPPRVLALSANASGVFVGTNSNELRRYDAAGMEQWRKELVGYSGLRILAEANGVLVHAYDDPDNSGLEWIEWPIRQRRPGTPETQCPASCHYRFHRRRRLCVCDHREFKWLPGKHCPAP